MTHQLKWNNCAGCMRKRSLLSRCPTYVGMKYKKWHKYRTNKDMGWFQLCMFHCHYQNTTMKQKTWCQIFNKLYNFVWRSQVQGILLDAFTKSQRATISFAMSSCVCQSNSHQHSAHPSTWNDSFHENWYLSTFRITAEKIQISRKYDKNNGYFTWRCTYIYGNILLNSS